MQECEPVLWSQRWLYLRAHVISMEDQQMQFDRHQTDINVALSFLVVQVYI